MATVESCIATHSGRCELLNCLFGFYGVLDPAPLGYGRDEIEVIWLSGNTEWCEQILDSAVASGLIPQYRDVDGSGGDGGNGDQPDDGDGDPVQNPPTEESRNNFVLPLGVLAWLTTST